MNIFKILLSISLLIFACQHGKKAVQDELRIKVQTSPYEDLKVILDKRMIRKDDYEAYFIPPSFCTLCDTKSVSDSLFYDYKVKNKKQMELLIHPRTKKSIKGHLKKASEHYNIPMKLHSLASLSAIPLVQILKIEFTDGKVSKIINHETGKIVFP